MNNEKIMDEKIVERIDNTIKTVFDAKKPKYLNKYVQNQLGLLRIAFQDREEPCYFPADEHFFTEDAEFLTKLYNTGAKDEYSAKLMMKVMYGNKFDSMVAKYID